MIAPTDEQFNAACDVIRARGGRVVMDAADDWTSPVDLWRKLSCGGTLARFYDRLNSPRAPFHARRVGASGRLVMVRPTAELILWLRAPSQPGRRR